MEQENSFQFSAEQRETIEQLIRAVEKAWEVLQEMVRAFMDAVRKMFEGWARSFTHLQLLEWRLPDPIAKFLSNKIPAWLAFRIGFHWFKGKVQSLE
jgi:hypothetical protein